MTIDFKEIIKEAWVDFNPKLKAVDISDISAMVSTNHVFRVDLENGKYIVAKLSLFGTFQNFVEDHAIINAMSDNLLYPYENFVARSLVKDYKVFTYRTNHQGQDVWVVFYNPIRIDQKLPPRQSIATIKQLGIELANFHKSCSEILPSLPYSSKTMQTDIDSLLGVLYKPEGKELFGDLVDNIKEQCGIFLTNANALNYETFERIPVFLDWNIGNFSVNNDGEFASRWDYDWFRMTTRVVDFYFFARVVSDVGDKTVFSYLLDPLMEDRFIIFLKSYHSVFPLTREEVLFIKEAYRFFLLNYVVKYGRYFFKESYAEKLQQEAFELYFPQLEDKFDGEKLLKALNL